MTIEEMLVSFAIGLVASMIAAYCFLRYVLYKLRPKIEIAPHIALEEIEDTDWYWFKIINKSKYEGFDLKFNLEKSVIVPCDGGFHVTGIKTVEFNKDSFGLIPRRVKPKKMALNTTNGNNGMDTAPHCFQVRTKENLISLLQDQNSSLRLQVVVRHGLTGLSDSFEHKFVGAKIVKRGSFKFGECFEIL